MASKKLPRTRIELYFLNGAGKALLLDPKVDKVIDDPKNKYIEVDRKQPPSVFRFSRDFIAYIVSTKIMIDQVEENKLYESEGEERTLDLL